MKRIIFLLVFFARSQAHSQITAGVIDNKLHEIKSISYQVKDISKNPHTGFQPKLMLEFTDSALNYILSQDTAAIPPLIEQITDSSLSDIKRHGSNIFFKKGDLAVILISYIEFMPFALITDGEWCLCCDVGYLPLGFLDYVNKHRIIFQEKYKAYYYSQKRKESIKQDKKNLRRISRKQK